jgi:hypothetical protein
VRWAAVAAALVVAGIALRLALYFPLSAFPIDSDGVLSGLCALAIRAGERPVFFPGGYRLGAASCYVTSAFFTVAGTSRAALALTGLTWGVLYLAASAALARAAFGARTACIAIALAALPPAAFLTVTYVPWGYGEIAASCAATLWLAIVWRRRRSPWIAAAFGLSAGFGVWMSLQTAMVTLPALVWIVAYRRPNPLREWLPAVVATCAGAAPWLIANLTGGFPTFARNWVVAPASGPGALWSNAGWFFQASLAQLFVYGGAPSIWLPLCVGSTIAVLGFVASLRAGDGTTPVNELRSRDVAWLFGGVLLTAFVLDVFSSAGSVRGWTVRYVAPVYPAATLVFALGIDWIWRRRQVALTLAAVALLVLPNLALYDFPGTQARAVLRAQLREDATMRAFLTAHAIGLVYGDYFDVYHYNFDAHGIAVAVPSIPALDYLGYGASLGRRPVNWAMVAPEGRPAPQAVVRAGARAYDVGSMRVYVAPHRSIDAASLLAALRRMP